MKCKFEHDGNCCNSGAKQYMCKCQKPCDAIIQMTNAQKIRFMSDEELAWLIVVRIQDIHHQGIRELAYSAWLEWLQQPAE